MPRRTSKNPLEWVTDVINDVTTVASTSDESPKNGRIQLLLDRDEVADIYKVRTIFRPDIFITSNFAADEQWKWGFMHSTDPRVETAFVDEEETKNLEDRNIFNFGFFVINEEFVASISNQQRGHVIGFRDLEHEIDFGVNPLTVGGDIGWCVSGQHSANSNNGEFITTVYFKRRKSNAEKANLLILRR